ncbi:hypothetical protein ACFL6I_21230 [candidate division KSB1 bacterium]
MKLNKTIKKIGTAAIGTYMALVNAVPALAADASVEVMHGTNTTTQAQTATVDAKVMGSLGDRFGYFGRLIETVDMANENEVGTFALMDLSCRLGKGFDVVGETQFIPGMEPDLRAGIQYFKKFENGIAVYALATRNFTEMPNTELVGLVTFNHKLNENLGLTGSVESVVNIGDTAYNFDSTKVRAGINYKGLKIGPAANISGLGTDGEPEVTVGGFVAKEF